MSELRLFGKEVTVRLTQAGDLLKDVTAIKSFTFEVRQRIITEGYLGETAMRQDEIFDEVGGSLVIVPETTDLLALQRAVYERSVNRTANPVQISATFRAQFPNGQVPRITIPEMRFDPIPFNAGSRDAYVEMTLTYKASSYILTL